MDDGALLVEQYGSEVVVNYFGWIGQLGNWATKNVKTGLPRPKQSTTLRAGVGAVTVQSSPSSCVMAAVNSSGTLYIQNKHTAATASDTWAFFGLSYFTDE